MTLTIMDNTYVIVKLYLAVLNLCWIYLPAEHNRISNENTVIYTQEERESI
jgi:hypothetical protein